MKITIDTTKCSGHARCWATTPDVFDLDDSGYALPLEGQVPAGLEEGARAGALACPERAITVE
ncbi:ferredoxin [Nocardia jiangxiensis]|uniref:Ferredoxin n=1 Tax=Nocardia jiangxiensis TaxID=282685 RepID=A0ABW6RU31_9NOCA|nr:ferredoxin [Nocardia jiangxiensis]